MAKATRQTQPASFVPVILTLESQDEVDAIYAALNHSAIADVVRSLTQGADVPRAIRRALVDQISTKAGHMHARLIGKTL